MDSKLRNGAIVIPAYKPDNRVTDIVRALSMEFCIVVVVDDGSGEEYKSLFDEIDGVLSTAEVVGKVLHHHVNMGKGNALKTAFDYILTLNKDLATNNKIAGVITVDADGQHKIEDIIKVYEMLEDYPDKLILGCRTFTDKEIPLRSRFGNTLTHYVFKWCCGIDVSDTQTGLRGIPISFLKECCEIRGERYEYETNMLLNAQSAGIEFVETKIDTIYEEGNPSSHFNPFVDSLSIYRIILTYSLSSLLAWLIDIVVFMACSWIGLSVFVSNYAGRALSALVNYNINKKIVFRDKNKTWISLIRYIILLVLSGTVSSCLIILCRRLLPISVGFIKIIVEMVLYFANYYVQHTFVFGNKTQKVTDWTAYYKKKRSFFSTFTQKATLQILMRYLNNTITSMNQEEGKNKYSLLELGGGNSCFADELCDKCKIDKYDIIDNNKYAVNLFREKELKAEHEAFCINLLEEPESDVKQYDFVYSVGLIEHFLGEDIKKVIEQHFARAKSGGMVLITFPTPTIKYRIVRGIMEVLGVWQFADENPLKFDEVKDCFARNGTIEDHFLNNKLPLTQYVVVARKMSDK